MNRKYFLKYLALTSDILADAKRGNLVIIGSRPLVGKTTLALNMLYQIQNVKNQSALYITLDTSFEKIKAKYMNIKKDEFRSEDLKSDSKSQIWFCELISESIEKMTSMVRLSQNILKPVDYVFIDYFQLLQSEKIFSDYQEKMNFILFELKKLALEQNIVIVALAQLNRSVDERPNHRPELYDLRDVSDFSQIDQAIYLFREDFYSNKNKSGNEYLSNIELIDAK